MTLVQLRYLVAIIDAGLNITQAAERVHATQPGLSKQLKLLEDELGFLLFSRKGRSLETITPAGEKIVEHARRILAEAANIRSYAANARGDDEGRLTVVTTHTQARYVLPSTISAINREFPRVSIHLMPADEGDVLPQLIDGEADFAVISTTGDVPQGGLAIPLYRWQRVALVPRGHRFAGIKHAIELADLVDEPLVSYESSIRPESSLKRALQATGKQPRIAMTARDADLIKTYVRAGLGVGVLAEMAISISEDADLTALALNGLLECTAWAVLPRERVLRDYALALLKGLAPQLDRRDVRRVLEGNQQPNWPTPPTWTDLSQAITN